MRVAVAGGYGVHYPRYFISTNVIRGRRLGIRRVLRIVGGVRSVGNLASVIISKNRPLVRPNALRLLGKLEKRGMSLFAGKALVGRDGCESVTSYYRRMRVDFRNIARRTCREVQNENGCGGTLRTVRLLGAANMGVALTVAVLPSAMRGVHRCLVQFIRSFRCGGLRVQLGSSVRVTKGTLAVSFSNFSGCRTSGVVLSLINRLRSVKIAGTSDDKEGIGFGGYKVNAGVIVRLGVSSAT